MSSLIPERSLIISPSLATTIGLEEAVLLQVLNDATDFSSPSRYRGFMWFTIAPEKLQSLLPFWEPVQLQRISQSLSDKGIIHIELTDSADFTFAMNEPGDQRPQRQQIATRDHRLTTQSPNRARGASLIPANWRPDDDLLELLKLNHAIPRDFALQQLDDFLIYWRDRQQVSHSWSSKYLKHVLKHWRSHQSQLNRQAAQSPAATVDSESHQWAPSEAVLEILLRDHVNREFIDDTVPEFVLYWSERGEASKTWNSKFLHHVRRQWAKYTKTMELDYEPRAMIANWQPSEDVFDILRLANIDIDFARQIIAEFVLFWCDTKEIHRSWNTKFLQHAKYQWATRHQVGQYYAGQQVANKSGSGESKSTFEHLTDRSWADGLIEGG